MAKDTKQAEQAAAEQAAAEQAAAEQAAAEQAAAEQAKTTVGLTPEEKAAALKSLNQKLLGTKK